jgi:DNA-binding SARP family transcriptional activator
MRSYIFGYVMQMVGGEYVNMKKDQLKAKMLGECALTLGEIRITDSTKRTSKVWLLLAYLICNRDRCIAQEELNDKLWGSEGEANGSGVLKTTLWRVRQLLQPISEALGQDLIIRQGGAYGWNPEVALLVDTEQMERLCSESEADAAGEIDLLRQATALYAGDFLEKFSAETWVEPISAYYYNMYLDSVIRLSEILPQETCAEEIEALCRAALRVAPYQELLYQRLMRALMIRGENEKAAEVYEEMRVRLFNDLGIQPS